MTPPLFLPDDLPASLGVGDEFELGGEEGRHAARVRRLATGEAVLVADGDGLLVACEVIAAGVAGLTLRVLDVRTLPQPRPRFVVVQALPKGERADLAVELLTELGVDEIVPWPAARSVVRWDEAGRTEKALARWRRTAREAAKQSRRARVPVVTQPRAAAEVVAEAVAAPGGGFVLHEDATAPLAEAPIPVAADVVVVVGPEGGITPDELEACVAAGALAVRLGAPGRGDPVLRTSTAGAAALAVLSARTGRWR